ncbi:lasso peptide biosynthesis B2 protein [Sphingobium sp. H39-3-25]|uniref:lasso peptide biosynthesis B2 protein n=1 Tax=Sphingomonadales TaxID=204457 RepID=UPI000AA90C34|nr:lasso peptide biosynthesis B2 protein [Sphingomonas pollutisoli]MDF0491133.1 lasso peptide biosynthesis B2 protein [Sphingomonas pollutisoli]MDF0545135.1 lasso peptide biosynthesis B2 protein [Sphingobium arseniciresistens]
MRVLAGRIQQAPAFLNGACWMLSVRENLHHCFCGGRAIFLDAAAGRYFCLPPAGETAFEAFVRGAANPEQIDWLRCRNILTIQPAAVTSATPSHPNALDTSAPVALPFDANAGLIALATVERLSALLILKINGFPRIYRHLARKRRATRLSGGTGTSSNVDAVVGAFAATDFLFGRTNTCLPRSLAFLSMCNRRGYYPQLVIGVRVNPFTAHCWIQDQSRILTDSVDQVRIFTPILAL